MSITDKISLTTLQSEEAYRLLMKTGVLYGKSSFGFMSTLNAETKRAYEWMKEQTKLKTANPTNLSQDLLWAWAEWDGYKAPIDLRRLGRSGENYWRLDLLVPRDQVLLSNFQTWHLVLGGWSCTAAADDDDIQIPHTQIEESWQSIFQIDSSAICVQATLLSIQKEWITKHTHHKASLKMEF